MSTLLYCPSCGTENFIAEERARLADAKPVPCWKCEKLLGPLDGSEASGGGRRNGDAQNGDAMEKHIAVFMTASSQDEAAKIARTLVEERLVACVNIVPSIRSVYWWEGKVCDEGEVLLIAKTRRSLFERLSERVGAIHSYEVPEVVGIGIVEGSGPYLEWIDEVLGRGEGEK